MPYITAETRTSLDGRTLDQLCSTNLQPGELAYCLYRLAVSAITPESRYEQRASILGVLNSVVREFERRILDPYEEAKRAVNGDVGQ